MFWYFVSGLNKKQIWMSFLKIKIQIKSCIKKKMQFLQFDSSYLLFSHQVKYFVAMAVSSMNPTCMHSSRENDWKGGRANIALIILFIKVHYE